jgi:hypothetical protein
VSSLYRETVAGAVVEAVQKGRRRARPPKRAAALPMLAEAPRRITEILTHRRPSPSDVATAQRHQRRWMAWGRGGDDPATPPLENHVWDGEYDACGSANYIETHLRLTVSTKMTVISSKPPTRLRPDSSVPSTDGLCFLRITPLYRRKALSVSA